MNVLTKSGTEAIQRVAPRIAPLLNAENEDIRFRAAEVLNRLGLEGKTYAAQVKVILDEEERKKSNNLDQPDDSTYLLDAAEKLSAPEIRAVFKFSTNAENTLRQADRQSKALSEKVSRLLDDPDPHVCARAASALGQMQENAQAYISQLAGLLDNPNREVSVATVKALIQLDRADKISAYQLRRLLERKSFDDFKYWINSNIIETTGQALIPKLIELLDNPDDISRPQVIELIGRMDKAASPYAARLAERLDSQDPKVQWEAAKLLSNMGAPARPFLAQHVAIIAGWLNKTDEDDRSAAVKMLGTMGEAARPYVPRLGALLENCRSDCEIIATALGNIGEASQVFALQLADLLIKGTGSYGSVQTRTAIYRLGKTSQPEVWLSFLTLAYEHPEQKHQYRVDAYLLFGHNPQMREATAWLGKRRLEECPDIAELDKPAKIKAINALRLALQYPDKADFRDVAVEAATHISRLVASQEWALEDAPWLETVKQEVHGNQPSLALEMDAALDRIRLWQALRGLAWAVGIQAAVWVVLILLYPWSPLVQGLVFRHVWFRRCFGFGYVNLLLTSVPWLRRRLFKPFRPALVPPGVLLNFHEDRYYDASEVLPRNNPGAPPQPATALVAPLNGQHIIEGASGLGKTTLLRHLALRSRRPTVLLRAVECDEGVLAAIQRRLQGQTRDEDYLRILVHAGGLDILIDGLNEAPPDTRARISQFFQEFFRGHFVLTTQPLAWEPPMTALVWELQPLAPDALEAFLLKQWPGVKTTARLAEADYQASVRQLLAELRQQAGSGDEVAAERLRMLCNPMESVFAAELLAQGVSPEPGRVLAQIFRLAEQEYRRVENRDFPRVAFAERVYDWRISGAAYIDIQGFEREARCLVGRQLMRERTERLAQENGNRDETRWQFRHDKVMDFFLVPAFRGEHAARRYQECGDPRFSGVHDLLAEMLPWEEADELRQFLVERGAETADNTLMNRYTRLFRAREKRPESQAERQFLDAKALLREAADLLGSASFPPDQRERLPERVQRIIRTAERDLRECLVIWQPLNEGRRAETEALLEMLEQGVLTAEAMAYSALPHVDVSPAEPPFDVFLSHNSKDKPAVRELAEALRASGLRVWLDEWELVPGRTWQEAIEDIIRTARAAAVLVGADGLGPWEIPEMRACLSEFTSRELPVIPVILPGAPAKPALPLFLNRFTWVDLRGGLDQAGLERLVWGITGRKPVG